MSKREDGEYQKWLDDLKRDNPDLAANLDALAATEAGKELFRGNAKREPEFYRRLNEYNEKEKELQAENAKFTQKQREFEEIVKQQNEWYESAKPTVDVLKSRAAEADVLQAKLEAVQKKLNDLGVQMPVDSPTTPNPAPRSAGEDILLKQLEEIQQRQRMMDQAFPQVMGEFLSVVHRAQKEGFDVDPREVLATVYKDKVTPSQAYENMTRDERDKRSQEKYATDLKNAKEEGAREALSKLNGPDRLSLNAPSIVEALRGGDAQSAIFDTQKRRDAAVQDWLEIQANA